MERFAEHSKVATESYAAILGTLAATTHRDIFDRPFHTPGEFREGEAPAEPNFRIAKMPVTIQK